MAVFATKRWRCVGREIAVFVARKPGRSPLGLLSEGLRSVIHGIENVASSLGEVFHDGTGSGEKLASAGAGGAGGLGSSAERRGAARAAVAQPPRPALAPAAEAAPPEVGFGMEPLDAVMRETMKKFGVPGGALAVAKDGKLVVAKGYGWANVAAHQPVTMDSLFCLASVSKAVTSVAALCLVQEGKLSLDGASTPCWASRSRWTASNSIPASRTSRCGSCCSMPAVSIRARGANTCGWRRRSPSRRGTSCPFPTTWSFAMRFSRPLAYQPGREEHYSNFGFFLRSEVIQRTSGQSYEQYVRQHVLRPAGIADMELERLAPSYTPNEVRRYGPDGLKELPGGRGPIGPPAGSWIGSAVDMARLLTAVDGSHGKSLLSAAVYREMLAPLPRR